MTSRCRPCPEHGLCKYGKLSCVNGYIYSYGYCVPDKRRLKTAYKMINYIKNHLHKRAGKFLVEFLFLSQEIVQRFLIPGDCLCGYTEKPEESKSELEAFLRSLKVSQ